MARIIYPMLMSLDGYIAGPEGGPSLPVPGTALHRHFNDMMARTAVALYGRRMYEVMRVWESWGEAEGTPEVEIDFAESWRQTPKIVFSTTLREVGPNARLVTEDAEGVARSVKADTQGDIAVAGAGLAASLARAGLVDEYQLYLQPVVLGGGKPYFEPGLTPNLKPLGTERLADDVILLRYAPAD